MFLSHLAPTTAVSPLNTMPSITRYIAAGMVANGPTNKATDVNVPNSLSNLSSNGTRMMRLKSMCQNPRCTKTNVFSRYMPPVKIPIRLGFKLPHSITDHTVCNSNIQKTSTTRMTARVNSGRRRMYVRARLGLKKAVGMGRDRRVAGGAIVAGLRRRGARERELIA